MQVCTHPILSYPTLHVCSFPFWYPTEDCFGVSCRPFRYPLKSVPVHFGTLGSPFRPVSVLSLYEVQFGHFLGPFRSVPVRYGKSGYPYRLPYIYYRIYSKNRPFHFLWGKGSQMPYEMDSRHIEIWVFLTIFCLKNVIFRTFELQRPGRLLEQIRFASFSMLCYSTTSSSVQFTYRWEKCKNKPKRTSILDRNNQMPKQSWPKQHRPNRSSAEMAQGQNDIELN